MAYKILWYSIPALHDHSNGAAIHNKLLLEALAKRGYEVKVLNALVGDDPSGLEVFNRIASVIKYDGKKPFLQFTDNGVEYIVVNTKGRIANQVNTEDQGVIFDIFNQFLQKFQPDVLMGYSGDFYSAFIRHEAKVRGIPVVYALCNGLHRSFAFPDCDLVFAPSQATAKMYKESDDIDVWPVGNFIDAQAVIASKESRKPQYITLINPTPEKGLAIFVKLAQIFREKHPEQKFLVVKSVGDYPKLLRALHYADGTPFIKPDEPNPIPNIDVAEHTNDIRLVYAITKVLAAPSVWHESWGCVATEATFNGIPVLATTSGGLPEAVGEGGILLDPPASTARDYYCVPSDEEVQPYVEALERLLNEDWTAACERAAAQNDIDRSVDRLLERLEPLMQQGQKNKDPFGKSFFFSHKAMERNKQMYEQQQQQLQQQQQQQQK